MEKQEIERIVDAAINSVYKQIQDRIGVTSGDWATMYHSGDGEKLQEELTEFLVKYVAFEKRMAEQD